MSGTFSVSRFAGALLARAASATHLLFPPRCAVCKEPGDRVHPLFCPHCLELVCHLRNLEGCGRCGAPIAEFQRTADGCTHCVDEPRAVAGLARVGPYRDEITTLVRQYKYHGRESLGPTLSAWLVEAVSAATWLPDVELVASVPTHWTRRVRRPFYPAEELARGLARAFALPLARPLRRVRAGRHQIGLSPSARYANVKGAFAMRRGATLDGESVLLVDDVRTTGATLNECAKVLKARGSGAVYGAVLGCVAWQHLGPGAITIA